VEWTLAHTAPGDLVAADDDGAVFLYTGRRTVPARSFTAAQYLTGRSSSPSEGIVPILAAYPVRAVVVGTAGSYEAAASLAVPPTPQLSAAMEYAGGAAFTVLPR
jgi:predicted membrane-bound mannosyltransferase